MSRSDDLAAAQAREREARERRTAAAAALRDLARNGTAPPPAGLVETLLQRRHDGTPATLRDTTPARNRAGDTNHADDITSGPTPLGNRED